jgi:hypothetical protein
VRKRDGTLEPFEADRINRTLFTAMERLGQPDAFVARELTDGVLHFLAAETDANQVASHQIEETLIKVVRELGQGKLARALGQLLREPRRLDPADAAVVVGFDREAAPCGPPPGNIARWLESRQPPAALLRLSGAMALHDFSLEQVFSRNLAAAHREGLLQLDGLESPIELATAVVRPGLDAAASGSMVISSLCERLEQARHYVGSTVIIDAPERELARHEVPPAETASLWRVLALSARATGLTVVLDLASDLLPDWAEERSEGPLFAMPHRGDEEKRVQGHLEALLAEATTSPFRREVVVNWHLGARDFVEEERRRRLWQLARAALQGAPITFLFDRPRRPVVLAEGVDRRNPAVLQWVGLRLPYLRRRQGTGTDPEAFLAKLRSLARLAASAGVQKRDFLRRHPRPERPAFLVERAHLGIHLIGVAGLLQELFGGSNWEKDEAATFVAQMLRTLQETLDQEARSIHLTAWLDARPVRTGILSEESIPELVATAPWKARLKRAGTFHAILGRGTVSLDVSGKAALETEDLLDLLAFAWKQTRICRLRLVHGTLTQRQMSAPWADPSSESSG